jgi:hypothetical protein
MTVDTFRAILESDLAQRDRALAERWMTRQEYRDAARTDVASIGRNLDLMRPSDDERGRLTDFIDIRLAQVAWQCEYRVETVTQILPICSPSGSPKRNGSSASARLAPRAYP